MSDQSSTTIYEGKQVQPDKLIAELAILRQLVKSIEQTLGVVVSFVDNLSSQLDEVAAIEEQETNPLREAIFHETMGQPDAD